MADSRSEPINVVVSMDFSDALLDEIRAVSPQLHVERHFPNVPEKVWASTDVLYTGRNLPDPAQAPRLKWIQFNSAGIDHSRGEAIIQTDGISVTSASGIHATQMAEFCLGMMLAFNYKLRTMLHFQARSEWQTKHHDKELYEPRELRGQTLGLVGYGSIARELARIADSMGMIVLASKRDIMSLNDDDYAYPGTGDPTGDIPNRFYPNTAVASMARDCDYLVLTLPLTDGTRHMVNAAVFNEMKPTAVLINVGRGGTVDEAALIRALADRKIAGAALDVFEEEPLPQSSPLWKMENVIISPHISGNSVTYHEKAAALFIENLQRFLENRPLLNLVKHGY